MASRIILLLLILLTSGVFPAQVSDGSGGDYKDQKSHERFRKRRFTVSAWQIEQLKKGALVVRLKTNQHLIDAFKKRGLPEEAERARLEQVAANLGIMRSYMDKYKFSKLYFIYSHSTDSLLNGKRAGVFLDHDLKVDPSITMQETFYLIAERDYVFNSSIGFVPEDSASKTVERGNPSASEFPIVVKNKYGHQLKNPFPYSTSRLVLSKRTSAVEMVIEGQRVPFTISSTRSRGGAPVTAHRINGRPMELILPRMFTFQVMSQVVEKFNADLNAFYRNTPPPTEDSKEYLENKQFFY